MDRPDAEAPPEIAETAFILRARTARDLMTASPLMVFETDALETAAAILARFSAVPVVDLDRHVVGVLSRTDVARSFGARGAAAAASLTLEARDDGGSGLEWQPPARRVGEVMTRQVWTVPAEALASEVVRALADKRLGRLFVVDGERHLIGVVSTSDVIAHLWPAE
jgi:CBS domain-containing membrane protein